MRGLSRWSLVNGLDRVLRQLTGEGASLLLTTQYIEEAERLAAAIVIIDRGHVIARGTPGELRAQAGGDRLDLQAPPGQDPRRLAAAVAALGTGESAVDEAAGRVVLAVADGAAVLTAVAGRLAAAGLQVSALALRRPTLEEAFLALTAHGAGRPRADAAGVDGVAADLQFADAGESPS
jgi:ABC-2 type transport system ATP-binding protein